MNAPATRQARYLTRTAVAAGLVIAAGLAGCRSTPGTARMRAENAAFDLAELQARAPVIEGAITLADALDLAMTHNIDVWIAAEQCRFQEELADHVTLKMLPSILASGGQDERNHYDASASESLETGRESLEPSLSSERRVATFDVTAVWNLLDFGMSYLRARQQADRVAMAAQRERRVKQNLAWQVTQTYMEAVTARESAQQAVELNEYIEANLERIRKEVEDRVIAQIDGLKQETMLLGQQQDLRRYERAFVKAKANLAQLVGLPPGTSFTLAPLDLRVPEEVVVYDVEQLEREALMQRPELFEKDLEQAISRDEVHLALAQMFPSPVGTLRLDYSSNRYLAYREWYTVGARASWDLLSLPQQVRRREALKIQTGLIQKQRMALAIAVLTQLHLALIDHAEAQETYAFAKVLAEKTGLLLEAVRSQADSGKSHEGELLSTQMRYLKARARYLSAGAALITSEARIANTVGRDMALMRPSEGDLASSCRAGNAGLDGDVASE